MSLSLLLSFRSSLSFLPFSLKPDTSFSRTFPFIFFYSHSFFIFFFVVILLLSLTSYIRPSSRIAHTLNDVSPSPSLSHFLSFSCFPLSCDPLFPHPTTACSFSPSSTSSPSPSHSSAPYRVLLVELYAPHPSDRSHIHRTTITLTTRLPLFLPFNPPGQLLSGSSCVIDVRRCTGLWRCFSCFRHLIATRYVTL